jgi:hypothetical protein
MTVGERSPAGRRDGHLRRRRLTLAPDARVIHRIAGVASAQVCDLPAGSVSACTEGEPADATPVAGSAESESGTEASIGSRPETGRDDPSKELHVKVNTSFADPTLNLNVDELSDEAYHEAFMAGFSSVEALEIAGGQRSARADLLSKAIKSGSEEEIAESFWREIGFPKSMRWWEDCEPVPDGTSTFPCRIRNSTSDQAKEIKTPEPDVVNKEQSKSRPRGRTLLQSGIAVRPWKGPIPRRPPSVITLEAFFPKAIRDSWIKPTSPGPVQILNKALQQTDVCHATNS